MVESLDRRELNFRQVPPGCYVGVWVSVDQRIILVRRSEISPVEARAYLISNTLITGRHFLNVVVVGALDAEPFQIRAHTLVVGKPLVLNALTATSRYQISLVPSKIGDTVRWVNN